jgi:hypothetical protein
MVVVLALHIISFGLWVALVARRVYVRSAGEPLLLPAAPGILPVVSLGGFLFFRLL